jgi:hypothetical protein
MIGNISWLWVILAIAVGLGALVAIGMTAWLHTLIETAKSASGLDFGRAKKSRKASKKVR